MKNKGFTLIELLAVIVILAIISLIATPIILNIIKDSKEESNKRSIEMYAKSLKNSVAKYQLSGNELYISKLETTDGRNFSNINDFKVDYDGNVVCKTIEIYEDGNIYLDNCEVNEEQVNFKYGLKQSYNNGEIVYFNVMTGKGCTEEEYKLSYNDQKKDYLNSVTGYNGIIVDENNDGKDDLGRNSCLKFYAFNDDGGKKINLLLDHNTTTTVAWTTSEITTNANGPIDVKEKLKEDTSKWNVPIISKNYEYKGNRSYSINYKTEGYKARLIEANEIAKITGNINWEEINFGDYYYFDSLTKNKSETCNSGNLSGCQYGWLYDRSFDCKTYGCKISDNSNYGYWTSSAYFEQASLVWHVDYTGSVSKNGVKHGNFYGVRPVIEVLRTNL